MTGYGSLVGLHVLQGDAPELKAALYFYMLSRGVYMGSRGFMALNFEHRREHVERVVALVRAFCGVLRRLGLGVEVGKEAEG